MVAGLAEGARRIAVGVGLAALNLVDQLIKIIAKGVFGGGEIVAVLTKSLSALKGFVGQFALAADPPPPPPKGRLRPHRPRLDRAHPRRPGLRRPRRPR